MEKLLLLFILVCVSYGVLVFIFYPKGNINSSIISFQTNNSLFFSGFDIQNLFTLLEKIHLMSNETSNSIIVKIETFDLEKFLRNFYFDKIMSDSTLDSIGKQITGVTLKHIITAIMLYKIFTPLRYLATLTVSKVAIDKLILRGVIQPPPKGSSIKDMTQETRNNIATRGRVLRNKMKLKKKINDNHNSVNKKR
jgi:hypothetical protein